MKSDYTCANCFEDILFHRRANAVRSHLRILALMMLILVIAGLNACKKSPSEDQHDDETYGTLRFVFLADSRGDSLGYTVDTTALNPIIRCIDTLNPRPSFVVFGGDMSYRGYEHGKYTFQEFKDLFQSLVNHGIKMYYTVGNHELYHEHAGYGYFLVNQQHFQSTFTENLANGPAGYERLAYSFTDSTTSSFFAVLDPYFVTQDTQKINMGGHIDSTQMAWLETQVGLSGTQHKFLFIHVPYYYVDYDSTEASEADTTITRLWSFIDANKFDIYACGHSHLYARRTIDGNLLPDPQTHPPTSHWQNNVVQLLNGTCGAGSGGGYIDPVVRAAWNVHNAKDTYYFSVLDVSGNKVTVNSYQGYTGAYTVFDTFTVIK